MQKPDEIDFTKHSNLSGTSTPKEKKLTSEMTHIIENLSITTFILRNHTFDELELTPPPVIHGNTVTIGTAHLTTINADNVVLTTLPPTARANIEELNSQLKYKYKTHDSKLKRVFGAPLDIEKCFINLSIVINETQKKDEEEKFNSHRSYSHLYSSYEDIYSLNQKEVISPSEIFKARHHKIPKRIAIIGRAGIGKSALSLYLTNLWTMKNVWQDIFKVLIKIELRSLVSAKETYTKKSQLADIVEIECLDKSNFSKKLSFIDIVATLNSIPKETLVILDGWDEFDQSSSPCKDLIQGILNDPNISVIVLTRPHTDLNLNRFDLRLECIGFTTENIPKYIEQTYEDKSQIPHIIKFLKNNPYFHSLSHVPIILDMFCMIWDQEMSKSENTITLTVLYTKMMSKLWEIYVQKLKILQPHISASELIAKKNKVKEFICELAYKAMLNNNVMLSDQLVKETIKSVYKCEDEDTHIYISEILAAGFLHSHSISQYSYSYYFPHLTIQEYLAALHWKKLFISSDLSHQEQAKLFLQQNKYNPRFEFIFWFISGLLSDKEKIISFLNILGNSAKDLLGIYDLTLQMRCLNEILALKINDNLYLTCYFNNIVEQVATVLTTTHYRKHRQIIISFLKDCPNIFFSSKMIQLLLDKLKSENIGDRLRHAFDLAQLGIMTPHQLKRFDELISGSENIAGLDINESQTYPFFDDSENFTTVTFDNNDSKLNATQKSSSPPSEEEEAVSDEDDDKIVPESEAIKNFQTLLNLRLPLDKLIIHFYNTEDSDQRIKLLRAISFSTESQADRYAFLMDIVNNAEFDLQVQAALSLFELNYPNQHVLLFIIEQAIQNAEYIDLYDELFSALASAANALADEIYLFITQILNSDNLAAKEHAVKLLNKVAIKLPEKVIFLLKSILIEEVNKEIHYEAVKILYFLDKITLLKLYLENLHQKYYIKNKTILNWFIISRDVLYIENDFLCCFSANKAIKLSLTTLQADLIKRDFVIYYKNALAQNYLPSFPVNQQSISPSISNTLSKDMVSIEIDKIISTLNESHSKTDEEATPFFQLKEEKGRIIISKQGTLTVNPNGSIKHLLQCAKHLKNSLEPQNQDFAAELYELAYKRGPKDANTLLDIAFNLLTSKPTIAFTCFDKVLFLPDKNSHKRAYFGKAILCKNNKEYEDAIFYLEKAIALDKNYEYAWHVKGDIHAFLNEYDKAIDCFSCCLKINPRFFDCLNDLGMALWAASKTSDLARAEHTFELALKDDPHLDGYWSNRGDTLLAQGKHTLAIHDYVNAIKLADNKKLIIRNMLFKLCFRNFYYTAIVYLETIISHLNYENYKKPAYVDILPTLIHLKNIIIEFKTVFFSGKNNTETLINYLFFECEKRISQKKSITIDKKSIEKYIKSANIENLSYCCDVYQQLKNYSDALNCLDQIIQLKPEYLDAWQDKAELLVLMNRPEEAQAILDKISSVEKRNTGEIKAAQEKKSSPETLSTIHLNLSNRTAVSTPPASSTPTNQKNIQQNVSYQIPGLTYQKVPGDGHCLFHAVGLHVNQDQAYIRRIVAAHLEHNKNDFREFIQLREGQTIEEYIQAIREGKDWADHIEIEVLMRVLGRPIIIIGPDMKIRNLNVLERELRGDPIFVLFNGHDHYDAFLRVEGTPTRDIINFLTQIHEHSPNRTSPPPAIPMSLLEPTPSTEGFHQQSIFARQRHPSLPLSEQPSILGTYKPPTFPNTPQKNS